MLNIEELKQTLSEITDEELVSRIHSGNLTDTAHEVALKEIETRKIELSQFQLKTPNPSKRSEIISNIKPALTQAMRFPINAILGNVPLFKVLIFAFISAFIVNKLLLSFILTFILIKPAESYSFPVLYFFLAFRFLIFTYLSIALWRSAYNTKLNILTIAAFGCSALFVIFVIWSTYNTLTILEEHKPINSNSIMDNSVMHSQ